MAEADRAAALDRSFGERVLECTVGPPRPPDAPLRGSAGPTVAEALGLFEAQATSRHLDLAARALRARGRGYYTIGSSGHEGNAAVAAALRPSDPALLHYRSGAFYVARAAQRDGSGEGGSGEGGSGEGGRVIDPVLDVLLGVVASRDEPIAGGRHKVFGRRELAICPQTSTIASHLPRAVGLAFAIELGAKLGVATDTPRDAVVVCSFGDASINHSTAVGALNAARHAAYRQLRLPVLFVCEDNGLGISVPTPPGWIRTAWEAAPGLRYFAADGCDLVEARQVAAEAVGWVRERRRPALLHLSVVRLFGHAGSDVELAYRTPDRIRRDEARDPVFATARSLIEEGGVDPLEVRARYEDVRARVALAAEEASHRPGLRSADDVMAPLIDRAPEAVATEARRAPSAEARRAFFGGALPEDEPPQTLAGAIRQTLGELLVKYPEAIVFGEDVGRKGGVYGVTRGLQKLASPARVFDTLLDEQTILGLALGCGQHGLLPIAEIQYLAYLHNAEDQLRGEAATLRFFSQRAYANPMIVRVPSFAYQKGFGGHFHNDHSVAVLRDLPGVVVACPCRADDAAALLHTCAAHARIEGAPCVLLEPIALYPERDLYEPKDGQLCAAHRPVPEHVPVGEPRLYGDGTDLLLVSFGNGVRMSLRAARTLAADGASVRVMDLRWLAPLPERALRRHAEACGRVLVVDETRRSGGVSEGVLAALVDGGFSGMARRVSSRDCFVPLGPAAAHVLLREADVVEAARAMLQR